MKHSLLPPQQVVEHDFSRGPWWTHGQTFDVAWSVEFLDHVGRQYMHNYMPIFSKSSALLFISHSLWGGWHHVEVHGPAWWKFQMTRMGFVFSNDLTDRFRKAVTRNKTDNPRCTICKQGKRGDATDVYGQCIDRYDCNEGRVNFHGQHLRTTLMVFINPKVASLPQHAHLFGGGNEKGCFHAYAKGSGLRHEDNIKNHAWATTSFRPPSNHCGSHENKIGRGRSSCSGALRMIREDSEGRRKDALWPPTCSEKLCCL